MSKLSMPHKLKLAQIPTPIQELKNFTSKTPELGDVRIFVKRDDLTHGPAMGNKIRKLEFLFSEALQKKKKVIFTCGALQSNHARATAILSRELGLECVLFLKKTDFNEPECQGNYFFDKLANAKIQFVTESQYEAIDKVFIEYAEPYRKRDGVMPYFIPEGGSSDLGAFGYVNCFQEILSQCKDPSLEMNGEDFDSVVVANGSGGTHAGLLVGSMLNEKENTTKVFSFNVCRTADDMSQRVLRICLAMIQHHRLPLSFMPNDIHVIDGYVGPGYGRAEDSLYEFILKINQETGLLLDPVYTGKAFFGLIEELKLGRKDFGKNILFIHTGGFPSLPVHTMFFQKAFEKLRTHEV